MYKRQVKQQLRDNAFQRNGYTFKGWSTRINGEPLWTDCIEADSHGKMHYYLTTAGKEGQRIVVYALWDVITEYEVSFEVDGIDVDNVTLHDADPVMVPINGFAPANPTWTKNPEAKGSYELAYWSYITYHEVTGLHGRNEQPHVPCQHNHSAHCRRKSREVLEKVLALYGVRDGHESRAQSLRRRGQTQQSRRRTPQSRGF